jgi:hypothetical protein
MSSLWHAVFIQVLDHTTRLMLNLSGTPYKRTKQVEQFLRDSRLLALCAGSWLVNEKLSSFSIQTLEYLRRKITCGR